MVIVGNLLLSSFPSLSLGLPSGPRSCMATGCEGAMVPTRGGQGETEAKSVSAGVQRELFWISCKRAMLTLWRCAVNGGGCSGGG